MAMAPDDVLVSHSRLLDSVAHFERSYMAFFGREPICTMVLLNQHVFVSPWVLVAGRQ